MKSFLIAIGLVGGITALIVYFTLRASDAESKRQTAEAEAIGLTALPVEFWDGEDQEEGHTVTFTWVDAKNGVHQQELKEITWWRDGETWKVCYNPADPSDFRLYAADHVCGS